MTTVASIYADAPDSVLLRLMEDPATDIADGIELIHLISSRHGGPDGWLVTAANAIRSAPGWRGTATQSMRAALLAVGDYSDLQNEAEHE